ncbi:HlyD family efflux transporter periplasmic adaptor subunit [Francisella tularensis]|uniref:HlyD family efflux transporter periplasmic adaptor subunit n=1 Tax=Francisella tularensis TaxID=263 RepID=UPI00031DA037|nr:hlyD secretion family protein [Francisella tularensis]KFJ44370.1 hlyD secretion family protein [Francisella tularensis]
MVMFIRFFITKVKRCGRYSPVMTIINPDDVYVVFYLSKDDLTKLHIGQTIDFITPDNKLIISHKRLNIHHHYCMA